MTSALPNDRNSSRPGPGRVTTALALSEPTPLTADDGISPSASRARTPERRADRKDRVLLSHSAATREGRAGPEPMRRRGRTRAGVALADATGRPALRLQSESRPARRSATAEGPAGREPDRDRRGSVGVQPSSE